MNCLLKFFVCFQIKVEESIDRFFQLFLMKSEIDPESPALFVRSHVSFLKQYLTHLPTSYEVSESSISVDLYID